MMALRPHAAIRAPLAAAIALGVLVLAPSPARAQEERYPVKPIHIVVPASAGGINDILARIVGQKLSERFGQAVVVENRPGAGTVLGAEFVARARPDGYTLLIAPLATMAVNPAVFAKLPYAPRRDFAPVSLVASYSYILAVTNAAPVANLGALVDYLKANPGKGNAGGASVTFQLAVEMFKQRTGAPIQYIPYKGSNEVNLGLISGELLLAFVDSGPAAPLIRGGRFRALATTAPQRLVNLPELPTMGEAGIPDMVTQSWIGFFLPAATPAAIVRTLEAEIVRIVGLGDVREKLRSQEIDLVGSSAAQFAAVLAKDMATWSAIARAANIAVEP